MKFFFVIFVSAVFFFLAVRFIESKSVFFPTADLIGDPSALGLAFEDVYFTTEDNVSLNGWFVKNSQAKATFIHFHGNAGNISHRLEKIAMLYSLGVNVFIIDYRGYGKSRGQPGEQGIYMDAVAAFDYLLSRPDVDKETIVAYGDSLGGVAAVDLATKRSPAALIVDSSFSSAADVSRTIYPFIPAFLLTTKMDSAAKVKAILIPKLFIHSVDDEVIPFKLGRKLYDAAAGPKEFLEIRGGHNSNHLDSHVEILEGIKLFLEKLGSSV